ncbi:uncharacterized protein [Zea mays]|uniref:uncharacterized protein n=1 Tax=Zea mays TaxID=4577 RepID=UPI000C6C5DA4|nr:uncharacterized protein LOC109944870 [Zea mays]|eukprot:XP_023157793.1 uncharacterized protein LOC109944870 [Zea mays]
MPLASLVVNLVVEDVWSHPKVGIDVDGNPIKYADTQVRVSHLGHINSFAEVPRSVLQDTLASYSLSKGGKTKKVNQGNFRLCAKRTNTDEDILSKAQRMAAKRNLEFSYFQMYSLVKILETATKGGIATTNSRCFARFGSGGDGSLRKPWMALKYKN